MPLDPNVQGLMARMAAAGRPKIWEVTPEEGRQGFIAIARAVDVKDVPIGRIDNGVLPAPDRALPYRLYTPVNADARLLPGLVYFHGGGFVIGNIETHEGLCRLLANGSRCRVISVDYRLAPEHPFPAAVDDSLEVVRWVAGHSDALGIDRDRLAVGGDSAGGNLAAVVCQLIKHVGGPSIALQVLLCPGLDARHDTESFRAYGEGYFLEAKSVEWFSRHYTGSSADPRDVRLSPLLAADLAGLPAAHIHTAEFDPLRDEGKAYADRLEAAGVPVKYVCHGGMIHHFYAMAGAIPYARTAIEQIGAAIGTALA